MACNDQCNPCCTSAENTPENESLESQISNFTAQFFGSVIKTGSNGVVSWSLPCNLDVGLENNPRGDGEGLACYFLRLFQDGINGATGPAGDPGAAGADGNNAYSVTLAGFTQPSLAAPNVTVTIVENPAILEGLYVFIQTSGWYLVNSVSGGSANLSLAQAVASVSAGDTINAGKLVVPSGFPGQSVVGPQGVQGPQGAQGTPGESFTATSARYVAGVGTNYNLQLIYDAVDFVNSAPELLLPDQGTYLVTAVVDVLGLSGVAASDVVAIKLYNVTDADDIQGTEHSISNLIDGQFAQVVISITMETTGTNQTIAIYGKCSTADRVAVVAVNTTFHYVRLS